MFDVLVAGAALPPNPGELIESHAMEALLEQAKGQYDLVVIDTPPLTAVSDAFPLLGKVDGVIIVGRVGRNRRDVAQRLCRLSPSMESQRPAPCCQMQRACAIQGKAARCSAG